MYGQIRGLHRLLGLLAAPFIVMYAVSAVQMAHQYRFKPHITEQNLVLAHGFSARRLASELMDKYGYRGDLAEANTSANRVQITIARPGTSYQVAYDVATGATHVVRRELPFIGLLNRLHHLAGFHHDSLSMNAWAVVLVVISMMLIALGVSGVYMWFRLRRERLIGSILLGFNLLVSIVLLVMLRA